jgi:hypothetical protein
VDLLDIVGMVAFLALLCNMPLIVYFIGRVRGKYWFFNCETPKDLAEYQLQVSKILIPVGSMCFVLLLLFAYLVNIQTEPRVVMNRLYTGYELIYVRLIPFEKVAALVISAFACLPQLLIGLHMYISRRYPEPLARDISFKKGHRASTFFLEDNAFHSSLINRPNSPVSICRCNYALFCSTLFSLIFIAPLFVFILLFMDQPEVWRYFLLLALVLWLGLLLFYYLRFAHLLIRLKRHAQRKKEKKQSKDIKGCQQTEKN